jgi:hypothetical protein
VFESRRDGFDVAADSASLLGGLLGLSAVFLAVTSMWLLIRDPVGVAESLASGEVERFAWQLTWFVFHALRALASYV